MSGFNSALERAKAIAAKLTQSKEGEGGNPYQQQQQQQQYHPAPV